MDKYERREIKEHAKKAVKTASYKPGKLVLVHTAVGSGLALLIALVSFLLDQKIAGTSGLGGMDSRSLLKTAQSVLNLLQMVVMVFWSIGLVSTFMGINRGHDVQPKDLLAGFRNFGPVLRGKLLHGLILAGAIMVGVSIWQLTKLYNQYETTYTDIPDNMVDVVSHRDGDRLGASRMQQFQGSGRMGAMVTGNQNVHFRQFSAV